MPLFFIIRHFKAFIFLMMNNTKKSKNKPTQAYTSPHRHISPTYRHHPKIKLEFYSLKKKTLNYLCFLSLKKSVHP